MTTFTPQAYAIHKKNQKIIEVMELLELAVIRYRVLDGKQKIYLESPN